VPSDARAPSSATPERSTSRSTSSDSCTPSFFYAVLPAAPLGSNVDDAEVQDPPPIKYVFSRQGFESGEEEEEEEEEEEGGGGGGGRRR